MANKEGQIVEMRGTEREKDRERERKTEREREETHEKEVNGIESIRSKTKISSVRHKSK